MTKKPRLLIITAAFGEGHNSAARNLSLAAAEQGAETRVADPCMLSAPQATAVIQWGYRLVTTHFPLIWEKIYKGTDKCDFSRQNLPLMRSPENYLQTLVEEYQPEHLFDTITCRAFSDLPDFYRYAARLCAEDGRMLAMKGVYPMTEVECLQDKEIIDEIVALKVPGLDAERHLVIMQSREDQQAH